MTDARAGWREAGRRLLDAWPLTLGLAVLAALLLTAAAAWLFRRPDEQAAPAPPDPPAASAAATPPVAPAPAASPVGAVDAAPAASDAAPAEAAAPSAEAQPPAQPALAGLAGDWVADDAQTRSLTRVRVRQEGDEAFVRVWGRCHPTDCDWGEAGAETDLDRPKPSLSVTYEPGFATEALSLRLVRPGTIAYRVETEFTDGSGRGRQVSEGLLRRQGG